MKKLEKPDGDAYTAAEDVSFDFVIYEGTAVSGLDEMTKEAALAFLTENNIPRFVQTVSILQGESESEHVLLKNDEWNWTENTQYTVMELPDENTDYEFGTINNAVNRSYTFTYRASATQNITAMNRYRTWNVILSKVDAKNGSLAGGGLIALAVIILRKRRVV